MSSGSRALARARSRAALLAAIAALALIGSFLLTGAASFLDTSAVAGTRTILNQTPARDAALQFETQLAHDADAQNDAADRLLTARVAGMHTTVSRTLRTAPTPFVPAAPNQTEPQRTLILVSDAQLRQHARIVNGSWAPPVQDAGAPAPGVLQARAADALGIAVGDTLLVGARGQERAVVITGTWLPTDPAAARWFGDPAVSSGFDAAAAGPLMVDESWLATLPAAPHVRWTLTPDTARFLPEDVAALGAALSRIGERLDNNAPISGETLLTHGNLAATLDRLGQSQDAARAIATVPIVLTGTIALLALIQLARLLSATRRGETALLRARGASPGRLAAVTAAEAATVTIPAAVLGTLVARLLGAGADATHDGPGIATWTWLAPAVVSAAAVLVVTVVAWWAARAPLGTGTDSGRTTRAATVGATVIAVGAAALSLWQFSLYGSPLRTGQDGASHIDPLSVAAPALALLAFALLTLLVLGPLLSVVQAVAARGRRLAPALPSRQVARRVSVFSAAVLLVALSVSGTTFAAAYADTWSALDEASGRLANGADVRMLAETAREVAGPESLITAAPYAAIPGVAAAAVVLTTPARIGSDTVPLTALSALALPAVAPDAGGAGFASALGAGRHGLVLPDATTAIGATLGATLPAGATRGDGGTLTASAWLADADGALVKLPLGSIGLTDALTAPLELTATLPTGTTPWSVVAVEARLDGSNGASGIRAHFTAISGAAISGAAISGATASGAPIPDPDALGRVGGPVDITLSWNDATGRAMLEGTGAAAASDGRLPVILSDDLAARIDARVGSTLSILLATTAATVDATVAGTTPALAGTAGSLGVFADLRALNDYLLRTGSEVPQPGEVWMRTTHSADSVAAAARLIPHTPADVTTVASQSRAALLTPAATVLWWGAGGALLLTVFALLAIAQSLTQTRRGEVAVLRALGVTGAAQARHRVGELAAVVGAAVILGVGAGLVAAWLTARNLARAAVGDVASLTNVPLGFAWAGWWWLLGAFAVAFWGIGFAYARRVRHQAGSLAREESL